MLVLSQNFLFSGSRLCIVLMKTCIIYTKHVWKHYCFFFGLIIFYFFSKMSPKWHFLKNRNVSKITFLDKIQLHFGPINQFQSWDVFFSFLFFCFPPWNASQYLPDEQSEFCTIGYRLFKMTFFEEPKCLQNDIFFK